MKLLTGILLLSALCMIQACQTNDFCLCTDQLKILKVYKEDAGPGHYARLNIIVMNHSEQRRYASAIDISLWKSGHALRGREVRLKDISLNPGTSDTFQVQLMDMLTHREYDYAGVCLYCNDSTFSCETY